MGIVRRRYSAAILTVLASVPFAGSALALDFTPDTTRYLSDPSFLPKRGQLEGTTTYQYNDLTDDVNNTAGNKVIDQKQQSSAFSEDLAYGITDRLAVRGSISYSTAWLTNNYVSGQTYKFDSLGMSDPWLGLSYRLVEQKTSPVSVDGFIEYAPDLFSAKSASIGHSGTPALGGQAGEAVFHINREMKSLTVQFEAAAIYSGTRKFSDLYDGSTSRYGAETNYIVGLRTQTRLTNDFAINFGEVYHINGEYSASNPTDGVSYRVSEGNVLASYIGLYYNIVPNRVITGITYQNTMSDNTSVKNAVNYGVGSWSNGSTNSLIVDLHYLFF